MPRHNVDVEGLVVTHDMHDEKLDMSTKHWRESRSTAIIVVCSIFITLTLLAISLRFYARRSASIKLWWDDWLALASVPITLIPSIISILKTSHGFGRHAEVAVEHNPDHLEHYELHLYILLLFYNLSLALFKLSFLALYLRFFTVVRRMRIITMAFMIIIPIWAVGNEFALAFRCSPVRQAWMMAEGTCSVGKRTLFICQSVPTIFFDIAIILLPMRLVWKIQMDRSTRIALVVVFLLGGLVTIASIVRLVYALKSDDSDELDLMWRYVDLIIWSSAEPVIGLICCCLPTYGPLLRLFRNKIGLISRLGSSVFRPGNSSGTLLASAQLETIGTGGTSENRRVEYDIDEPDLEACPGVQSVKLEALPGGRKSVALQGVHFITTGPGVRVE